MTRKSIVDRAFWLGKEGSRTDPINVWALAVEAIDLGGDKAPLVKLLRSNAELPPEGRAFVADLLERYELRMRKGKPRTPAYDRTLVEAILLICIQRIREYRDRGIKLDDALDMAAEEFRFDRDKLKDAYAGKRGGSRRIKIVFPKQKPPPDEAEVFS